MILCVFKMLAYVSHLPKSTIALLTMFNSIKFYLSLFPLWAMSTLALPHTHSLHYSLDTRKSGLLGRCEHFEEEKNIFSAPRIKPAIPS
jgi:hypothetical protein